MYWWTDAWRIQPLQFSDIPLFCERRRSAARVTKQLLINGLSRTQPVLIWLKLRGSKCSPLILLLQKVQKRLYMPCDQLQYSNTTEVHKSLQSLNEYVLWRQLLLQLYTVCSCCSERFKICYRAWQIRLSLWAHKLYMAILEQLTSASNYYLYRVN